MLRGRVAAASIQQGFRSRVLSKPLAIAFRMADGSPSFAKRPVLRRCTSSSGATEAQSRDTDIDVTASKCSVHLSNERQQVTIDWGDGASSTFDNFYLLDHCRCLSCFHPQTKQRLKTLGQVGFAFLAMLTELIPGEISLKFGSVDNGNLHLEWSLPSQHVTILPLSFLRRASYNPPLPGRSDVLDVTGRRLWGSSIAANPPTVSYESVMPHIEGEAAEAGVLDWLNKVHEYGFCFVTGVPVTPEATEELIRRLSFIRETHYGGFWDFTADMSKGDLAYSNQALPAHTDTAYFTDPAGLQIFHCLKDGKGGETLLVDAFFAAGKLREKDPTAYATLSRLAVPFHASGNVGTLLRPPISQPVLRHDHLSRLMQVRWNNEDRCVLGEGWEPEDVRQWYRAARAYEDIVTSPSVEYWSKLMPGTVVVIDNWRVMHGRAAFTGERRMCGAYVGADDWRSRRRALSTKLNPSPAGGHWNLGW